MRLVSIIADHIDGRATATQIARAHPPMTLGQAHAALAYYYDHKDAVEKELARYERLRSETIRAVVAGNHDTAPGRG